MRRLSRAELILAQAILEPTWAIPNAPSHLIDQHRREIPAIQSVEDFTEMMAQYHQAIHAAAASDSAHAHALVHAVAGRLLEYATEREPEPWFTGNDTNHGRLDA
ncbi:MAG: hypothetical protein AAF708_21085 [Deinococcota bacterium]